MESFVTTVALIGIVIVIASLLSGAIERTGLPLVAIFLLLGVALGPWGLGITDGVRAPRNYDGNPLIARGAVRVRPDDPLRDAKELRLSKHATLVIYCA